MACHPPDQVSRDSYVDRSEEEALAWDPEKRGQNRSPIIRRQALGTEATRSPCEDCRGRRGSMRTHDRYLGTGDTGKRGAAGGGFQSQSALSFHPAVCPWARRGQAGRRVRAGPLLQRPEQRCSFKDGELIPHSVLRSKPLTAFPSPDVKVRRLRLSSHPYHVATCTF